jgi:hypothetical protein
LLVAAALTLAGDVAAQERNAHTASECIAANERAISLRKDHRLQSARAESVTCAAPMCPSEIRVECARRATQITAALPEIVFDVKDADGNDLTAVGLSVDGAHTTGGVDGTALVLDPGEHTFVFSWANAEPLTKALVLREGEKSRHESIVLGSKEVAPHPPRDASSAPKGGLLDRPAALGLAGLGVVGVAVGAIFGLHAGSAWSQSKAECGVTCPPTAHDRAVKDHDDAVQTATISTIAFVAGGALLAGGAVLFITPVVTPRSASVGLTARF